MTTDFAKAAVPSVHVERAIARLFGTFASRNKEKVNQHKFRCECSNGYAATTNSASIAYQNSMPVAIFKHKLPAAVDSFCNGFNNFYIFRLQFVKKQIDFRNPKNKVVTD